MFTYIINLLSTYTIIRLDLGQISFNRGENVFATQQLAFLPLASRFTTL